MELKNKLIITLFLLIGTFIALLIIFFIFGKETGIEKFLYTSTLNINMVAQKKLEISSVFKNGEPIPKDYTCEGKNINPRISIKGIPKEAKSLALIMDDPDAPMGTFVHWVIWNLPLNDIEENTKNGVNGMTSFGKPGYGGPCPPRGHGKHRYYFKVYALDTTLNLPSSTTKEQLLKAIQGHVVAYGEIFGTYERK